MYNRQESTLKKKSFWTRLGQYMNPIPGAGGDKINWLNYKTGIRHIYFRMDATKEYASLTIEITHPDQTIHEEYRAQFEELQKLLTEISGQSWSWFRKEENGKLISCLGQRLEGVNVLEEKDWPAIISFLKPRMIALDEFWNLARQRFE